MKIRARMMRRRYVWGVLMSGKPTVAVAALAFAVSTLLLESDCGNSPSAPAPVTKSSNYHGTFTSTNYPPTSLDMALATTGGGATQPLTGSYSTGNGITGQVQGTLTGSLDSGGSFSGTLTYNTSPIGGTNCNGSGSFSGPVSSVGGVDFSSTGFHSSCPGDPVGVITMAPTGGPGPVAAPPTPTVNVTGTWAVNGSHGESGTFLLTQSGSSITGTERGLTSTITGSATGSTITFSLAETQSSTCNDSYNFSTIVTGSTMTGTSVLTAFNCGSVAPPVPVGTASAITGTKQ
jgi:hypothetical protein